MTTKQALTLLAVSLAPLPLYAQETAAPAEQTPVVCPAQPQAPTAAQTRAATLGPVALLPADADMAIALPHLTDHLAALLQDDDYLGFPIDSAAIGFSKHSANTVAQLLLVQTLRSMREQNIIKELTSCWKEAMKAELRPHLDKAVDDWDVSSLEKAKATLPQMVIHPLYVVVSPRAGKEAELKATVDMGVMLMASAAASYDEAEFVQVGDLAGLKIKLAGLEEEQGDAIDAACGEEICKREFHLLLGMKDGYAIAVLCENPQEISLPETPGQSVLNNDGWAGVDGNLDKDLLMVWSVSPEMAQAENASTQPVIDVWNSAAALFRNMAGTDTESADTLQAAANGVLTIGDELARHLMPHINKPGFVQVWQTPGTVHIRSTADSQGLTFLPGKRHLAAVAANPDTALCVESTPVSGNMTTDWAKLLPAAQNVAEGVIATLPEETQMLAKVYSSTAMTFMPELMAAGQALQTLVDGLDNSSAIVIDGKGEAPACPNARQGCVLPRVAVFSDVKDRTKISQSWDELLNVAARQLEKNGLDPHLLAMLPIGKSETGTATTYSLLLNPLAASGAHVTVSDTTFTFGSSAELNNQVTQSATGDEEMAGVVLTMRMAPLAAIARSLAEMTGCSNVDDDNEDDEEDVEEEEAATGAATCEQAPAEEPGDDAEEEDGDVALESMGCCEAPACMPDLDDVADALESAARFIDSIESRGNAKDGIYTLDIDINLKK